MMRRFLTIAGLVGALLAATVPMAHARGDNDQDEALRAMRAGQIMPYNAIKRRVEAQTRGVVIGQSAPRQRGDRQWVYEFRVLVDNKVKRVLVDGGTGRVLK